MSPRAGTPNAKGKGPLGNLEGENSRKWKLREYAMDSFESQPEPNTQAEMVSTNWIDRDDWSHTNRGLQGDVPELIELARRKRREVIIAYPRKPCKDGWMGPVPPEARDPEATLLHNVRWWFYPCKQGGMPPFKYDGAIDQWRKTVVAFSGDHAFIMGTPIPRLDNYEDVEIMIVARPLRGAEGMGAAAVGKGHRSTYAGVRGPEMLKGKGRRRERNLERAQLYMAQDSMHRTGYTGTAAAPGVEPEIRDPAGLMGVKSTNSPARVEIPPTPPRSRRRDRRTYSPITSSSHEETPQSTTKLELAVPADPPEGNSLEPVCNLAVLTKSRRKTVLQGLNLLGEHDKALRTLFFHEQCCVTCGPKHVVAITSHPSAFQDPMIHCMDIGEAGSGHWDASFVRSTLQEISPSLIIIAVSYPSWDESQ